MWSAWRFRRYHEVQTEAPARIIVPLTGIHADLVKSGSFLKIGKHEDPGSVCRVKRLLAGS